MSKITNYISRKPILKYILIGILIFATVGGIFGGIVALSRKTDKIDAALTYKTVGVTNYKVGGLDPNGNYMSTDKSIYTKKAFECQGLNVTLDFDATVSYEIFFYDQDNKFVHTTGKLTGAFVQDSVPFFAKTARIVVTPNKDNKVTIFEISKYAKQLKTTVYREQGFKNYSENVLKATYLHTTYENGEKVTNDSSEFCLSNEVNITSSNEALMLRLTGNVNLDNTAIIVLDSSKNYLRWMKIGDVASTVFVSSEGVSYYSVSFNHSFFNGATFVQVCFDESKPVAMYCR